ncbi:HAMP domain-containing protein [Bacillus timonensis]|nr:HAMP domain-containing protein [Bacillus timonensis]
MKSYMNKLSFFKKTILFTSFIVLLVGFSTSLISYQIQKNTAVQLMADQAVSTANLWKSTLPISEIKLAIKQQESSQDVSDKLVESLDKINEKFSNYAQGYLLPTTIKDKQNLLPIAVASKVVDSKMAAGSIYRAPKEYIEELDSTINNKTSSYTGIYEDDYGTWITGFSPIFDEYGEVIAIFCIDIDASILHNIQLDLLISLFVACTLVFSVIFTIQDWGLRKMMSPLKDLFSGIHQVSQGNFNVTLNTNDQSEIGELSEKFNEMTAQLQLLFDRVAVTSEQITERGVNEALKGFDKALGEMDSILEQSKLQMELQRAERMNAIGQLAASVAHEIRNPMTVVKGFLQIFQSKDTLSTEEKEYIVLMVGEMNRAETIINDYLSLAKPDIGDHEEIDCIEITKNVTELITSYALMTNNIKVMLDCEEDSIIINGNKSELKQVLLNIMKNGIEAIKNEGYLSVKVNKDSENVYFVITDNGIGMTEEEVKRLGTPFYSLKEKGTGIGMMVCYQIIERLRGDILIQSKKGKGTTFTITLPLK